MIFGKLERAVYKIGLFRVEKSTLNSFCVMRDMSGIISYSLMMEVI